MSTVRAGAEEVREKLRQDLSRWMRVRRVVTLKPTIGCLPCDASGKTVCPTCDGSGRTQFVVVGEDDQETRPCATCEGTGRITCVECAGTGTLPNVHRKKILWVLILGALAWVLVLWTYLGRDILPAQRATLLHKGGGQSSKPALSHGGSVAPVGPLQPGGHATAPGPSAPLPHGGPYNPSPPGPGQQPAGGVPGAPAPGAAGHFGGGSSWSPSRR